MELTLMIQPLDEGGYFAQIKELPAVLTEGETLEEVRANIQDALTLYLSHLRDNSTAPTANLHQKEPIINEFLAIA